MPGTFRVAAIVAALAVSSASAYAADPPMKMDEPMAGEMKKDTMKKGDVKKAAEKKAREMKDVMDKESKSMPRKETKSK